MAIVLGVVGASGSGKSLLAQTLQATMDGHPGYPDACLLPLDAYYRSLAHLSAAEREAINFDHPDAIEYPLFLDHVKALAAGYAIERPDYDFSVHDRRSRGEWVEPQPLVIAEGILLAAEARVLGTLDLLVYVDTPLATCYRRRLDRDVRERGRSEASVKRFWESRVEPMFEAWVAPARGAADLVLSGEAAPEENVDRVIQALGFCGD